MSVVVVTPPAAIVTLEETKLYLHVDHKDDDGIISGLIAAGQQHIDGPAGWLGRSIGAQTLRLDTDEICGRSIELPCGPVIGSVVLKYLDSAGDEQTINSANYSIVNGWLWLAYGYTFPGTYDAPDAVRITYNAGYNTIPDGLKVAVKVHVAMNYDPSSAETLQPLYDALTTPYYVRPV